MALRGLAASGPGSRGPLDEAVAAAEERGAPAVVVAAGGAPEDDDEDEGRGRGLLRWDGFSAWLHCVCVVGFDLELGQAVEVRPGRTFPRASSAARAAERVARGPSGRASGRGRPPLRGSGRAAVHWQLPWEDHGLRLGVKSSLEAPPKYLLRFVLFVFLFKPGVT